MKELPKAYEPKNYEDNIYKKWEESGLFNPDICVEKGFTKSDAEPFSIVLPPPNVTGTLHMGHAAMLAIEDVMVRYHRMKGDRTLWVPGTDHAAIATQSKVEKLVVEKEGKSKYDLGRAEFLKRVEKFAQESHDIIVNQCKKMGASLDWSREAYTLDEKRNLAVRTVFKKMYDDGLIYRGYRVINWSVKGQSTVSDDEVVHVERPAKLYYFKYSKDFPITIATTRPETKLGDTAVAVNPKDKRYKKYIGQEFTVDVGIDAPLKIKIIGEESVDMNFGTGALGVTPAHSAADFEMYQKQKANGNDIGIIQVIGEDGNMTDMAGIFAYAGMPVLEARAKFLDYLKKNNLLEKEEEIVQNVGTSDRFGDVIEPLPKTQWFVGVEKSFKIGENKLGIKKGAEVTLKSLMQKVVKKKQIEIIPDHFEKTYFHWIDNLRDWCISRQLWYGHQISGYYNITDPKNYEAILLYKGGIVASEHVQNELNKIGSDFLSTGERQEKLRQFVWFSNQDRSLCGLTFRMAHELVKRNILTWDDLGYYNAIDTRCVAVPEAYVETPKEKFYFQDLDTLDTWFSSGLWTFSTLGYPDLKAEDLKNYHPTSVMETGYDIIFFWVARMILMTTYTLGEVPFKTVYLHGLVRDEQGRKMSKSLDNIINPLDMIAKYGTDATRLSLLLGNTPGNDMKLSEEKIAGFRNFTNKLWNISRFMLLNIPEPKMDIAEPKAKTAADEWILWWLEETALVAKHGINNLEFSYTGETLRDFTWSDLADWYLEVAKVEGGKSEILNYILNTILKLWHPYMPFVTEAIWREVYGIDKLLMVEKFPEGIVRPKSINVKFFEESIKKVVSSIRSLRAEYKIEPAKKVGAFINAGNKEKLLKENEEIIKALARLEKIEFVQSGAEVVLDLAGAVDAEKEKPRLEKEIAEIKKYVGGLENKLSNKEFVKNAPKEVVAKEQEKLSEAKSKLEKLTQQLENLK